MKNKNFKLLRPSRSTRDLTCHGIASHELDLKIVVVVYYKPKWLKQFLFLLLLSATHAISIDFFAFGGRRNRSLDD